MARELAGCGRASDRGREVDVKSLSALERGAFRALASVLSPSGVRGSLLVLMYHRVFAQRDPLLAEEPDAETFAAHMDLVRSLFNVLPLSEAVDRLKAGALPPRAACITFDDGYANNLTVAAPILAARKLPATVFVTTRYLNGGRMWNDTVIETVRHASEELDLTKLGLGKYVLDSMDARRAAVDELLKKLKYLEPSARLERVDAIAAHVGADLPRDLMLTDGQVRELRGAGIEIGAHTLTHPILTRTDDDRAREEIRRSKLELEDIVGERITTFAYPNGRPAVDYSAQHVAFAREAGFTAAFSTAWGRADRRTDLYQLPRVAPWDATAARFAARLVKTYVGPPAVVV
jgi:peptidoglycan/xylan/chitin deacetylase (PgdA/CDA1 family)